MQNSVRNTTFEDLLKTIGSGSDSSKMALSNCDTKIFNNVEPLSNGFSHQNVPLSRFDETPCSYMSNPFFDCNGKNPGPNPFAVEDDVLSSQRLQLLEPCDYRNDTGVIFNTVPDPPRPGELDKADSDSLSWLADPPTTTTTPPPPIIAPITTPMTASYAFSQQPCSLSTLHTANQEVSFDPLMEAALVSGIDKSPVVRFIKEPGDVQFRYPKELNKGTVSPIWADGAPRQYPTVEITNMLPGQIYNMELFLLNSKKVQSIHKFYQTKPLNAEKSVFTYPVTQNQIIELENIGVLRTHADKRGDNELHNSVILGVRLLTQSGWEVAKCQSKEILDLKKTNLKIIHINPQDAFNTKTRMEVTILCSKISDDTEVVFQCGAMKKTAEIILKHYGHALVVRPPTFEKKQDNFKAHVRLFCRSRNRYSEPKSFEYKVDTLDNIDTAAFATLHPARDRSPLRNNDGLVPDGIVSDFEKMTLKNEETIAECDKQAAALDIKMADLQKIRDVANGREPWSAEADDLLSKVPYVLHVQDSDGFTPPMRALLGGRADVFEKLLSGVSSDEQHRVFSSRTCGGATVLHLLAAVQTKVPRSLLQMMLDRGADPLKTDDNGQTMIHWLVRKQRVSLLKTTIECLDDFFRHRGDLQKDVMCALLNRLDNKGQAAIHCAVLSSAIGAIDVLVISGSTVDLCCPNSGLTALHWAIIENDAQAVEALIRSGASVHVKSNWGATTLDIACQNRDTSPNILQLLRDSGASMGSCRSSEEED